MRKTITPFGLMVVLILISCYSEKRTEFSEKRPDYDLSKIDSLVPLWQKELNVPHVGLAIIDNNKTLLSKVYGSEGNDELLFNVASVTKVVFTMMVLNMVESGMLNLDERISDYYTDPDIATDPRRHLLTPYHLLSQQSGFSHNWRWDHPTELLTFDSDPGNIYNYSGEGIEYLRLAIESKTKKSLSELADSILFTPLDMKYTMHEWDGESIAEAKFSGSYDTRGQAHDIDDHSVVDCAADDLITTISDAAKFMKYTISKARTDTHPYDMMVTPQASINDNLDQGLGWRLISKLDGAEYCIQHGGNDRGVAAIIALLPHSQRGIAVFTDGDNGTLICNRIIREVWKSVGEEVIHRSYKSGPEKKKGDVTSDELQALVGNYEQPGGRLLNFSVLNENLHLRMDGIPNLDFYRSEQDSFFSPDFDFTLVFHRDSTNDVNSCSLYFEGRNEIRSIRK